jgi:hypothetical protein
MNKLWHDKNKMPAKATLEQRINWHKQHQEHCACREAPKDLLKYFKLKKWRINARAAQLVASNSEFRVPNSRFRI